MKVDLTQEEIWWIQALSEKGINHWEDDLRDKEKNSKIAIMALREQ